MQSAAVPCTSNGGLKRTAANALASTDSTPATTFPPNHNNNRTMSTSPPPEKRSFIVIESPLKLGTIASAEDLDIKVLRIQNKNLSESLLKRQKLEADLRAKIDSLQNRKAADDNKLCIFDRYWTQLDEDLRLMLERFHSFTNNNNSNSNNNNNNNNNDSNDADSNEASTTTTTTTTKLSSAVRTFLNKINDWDKVEMEDKLKERVKFTTESVSKLMEHYDRQSKRYENYFKGIIDGN